MRKKLGKLLSNVTDDTVDYRIRLFYVLALGGIAISVLTLVISLAAAMWNTAVICAVLIAISTGLIIFTHKTGKYQRAYIVTVVAVFMVFFPIMFFTSGGHRSGMPSVFMFAVLFTVLMLRGRIAIYISVMEIIEYSAVCVIAYRHPEYVTAFETEAEILSDIIFAYSTMSIICAIVLYFHLKEYDRQRETLHNKNEKLTRYDASRSTFLTTVSHEIKNPLNAISLHARDTLELSLEEPTDLELIRENQAVIKSMVERIDRILVDLKDTVAIEQGRLSLSLAPMRTQKLISEAAQSYFGKNYTSENELILELDTTLPPIYADYARITQVITNLLTNALQHTKQGKIKVTLTGREGEQLVCVSDNGEGMSEELRQKALEGYVSASEDYWRHGIGLYVCHQIVEAHGGRIWIDSSLGEGTDVYFTLPIKEAP